MKISILIPCYNEEKTIEKIKEKNIKHITIGDTIFPNKRPNLNHNIFRGVRIDELIKPNIKMIIAVTKAHNLNSSL